MLWTVRFALKSVFRLLPLILAPWLERGRPAAPAARRAAGLGPRPGGCRPRRSPAMTWSRNAGIIDTRSLVIDAPPAAVWPWLVQLGYGRGGWYSYDRMDMAGRSADRILPEFQDLARR